MTTTTRPVFKDYPQTARSGTYYFVGALPSSLGCAAAVVSPPPPSGRGAYLGATGFP
jgi:hypothetical protein